MLWLAAIFFFLIRRRAKKWKKVGGILDFVLLLLSVWAAMLAPLPFGWGSLGGLLAAFVRWCFGFLGSWINVAVPVIAGLALVLVLWEAVHDLKDKKPDKWARTAVFVVPVLAMLAGGALATHLLNAVNLVGNVGPTVVGAIT